MIIILKFNRSQQIQDSFFNVDPYENDCNPLAVLGAVVKLTLFKAFDRSLHLL